MLVNIQWFLIDGTSIFTKEGNVVLKGRELSGWVILCSDLSNDIFARGIKVGTQIRMAGEAEVLGWDKYIMKMKIVPAHVYNFPGSKIKKISFSFEVSDIPPEKWNTEELIKIATECLEDEI